ncbi:putative lyase [Helianthus debilis subsp. tardiflorus]
MQSYHEADLYTISIHFQVFRIFGYKFSCDVFNKFKDFSMGEFTEDITTDARGMMSFYESAQLRISGESILDEAVSFLETKLKTVEKTLQGALARQVKHVLERPFHRGHPIDRVPECYVWILSLFSEPYYSQARIITTKVILLVLVLDDTYDAYATIEEIRLLTDAINRWDISAMPQLPEYIKPFYEIILNEHAEFNKQGLTDLTEASKKAFQEQARGYHQEAEWRHSGEVPSFEEYMRIGLPTSTHDLLCKSALIGMGKIVTQEAYAWYQSHPKIMIASQTISRLQDDVMTVEFERERAPSATGIDTYMKTFGVSENVAVEAINKMVENAWKDINEGCLKPREVPMDLLAPIVNLARMIDVAYKHNDGFTFPEKTLKEIITLLLCVSVPM